MLSRYTDRVDKLRSELWAILPENSTLILDFEQAVRLEQNDINNGWSHSQEVFNDVEWISSDC